MPQFHYQALNANGQIVSGDLEADDAQLAIRELQARGLSVQSIGLATNQSNPPPPPSTSSASRSQPLRQQLHGESVERAVLRSHMAVILDRGRPIAPALRAYAEEMPLGWQRRQLLSVCRILETGGPSDAATALAALPEGWIPLLSAATNSPDPGHVLQEFLRESQSSDELRQKWWLTLVYPLIVFGLALAVMTALSMFVITEFHRIFAEFDLKLPALTEFVLKLGSFFATWGVPILVLLGILLIALVLKANRLLPTTFLSSWGDRLRLPFVRRTAIARFSRFLADLLEAGVSMPDSLRIAGFTIGQSRIQQAAWQYAAELESTDGQSKRVNRRALTSTVALALSPDMQPDSRVRVLREISECHAERVRIGASWRNGLFEPLAICAVGLVVGCTVLGLFLPLVSLIHSLSS